MSELGTSVVQAIGFLRSFFGDVSKLVTVVEGEMNRANLTTPWGSNSIWGISYSYQFSSRWIPNYVCRVYVEAPPEGAKVTTVARWYAFFLVHFAPYPVNEPAAVWGTVRLNGEQNVSTSLNKFVLAERGPKFLKQIPVDDWDVLADLSPDVRELRYRACAVVDLQHENMAREVVLEPLLSQIESIRTAASPVPQSLPR